VRRLVSRWQAKLTTALEAFIVCERLRYPDGFKPDLSSGILDITQYTEGVMPRLAPWVAWGDLDDGVELVVDAIEADVARERARVR
jgi:hypothetical protein